MENTLFGGQTTSPAYDFRVYDRVWQRVAPGTDPFSEDPSNPIPSGSATGPAPAPAGAAMSGTAEMNTGSAVVPAVNPSAVPAPAQESGGAAVPGADPDPCCMGTNAVDSLEVLEGFIQEELGVSRCCQTLACRVQNQQAAQLLRRAACEKSAAARDMCAAYFLVTGNRYHPAITLEQTCWNNLPQALRSLYHQEACNGFNYQRAADETTDPCLTKLFNRLSEMAYRRADDLMSLLGRMVCC